MKFIRCILVCLIIVLLLTLFVTPSIGASNCIIFYPQTLLLATLAGEYEWKMTDKMTGSVFGAVGLVNDLGYIQRLYLSKLAIDGIYLGLKGFVGKEFVFGSSYVDVQGLFGYRKTFDGGYSFDIGFLSGLEYNSYVGVIPAFGLIAGLGYGW